MMGLNYQVNHLLNETLESGLVNKSHPHLLLSVEKSGIGCIF